MEYSPPKHTPLPSMEALRGKWQQYVGAARIAWGELGEDELLKLEGHTEKLAGLIHERYSVSRNEAELQVQRFFAKHHF